MASNGFAPPPPPRAEAVNTAAPTASPSSAVIAFHTRLIAALLASLPSLASQAPTSEWGTLAEALRAVDSWASLRDELNARLGEAGSALVKLDANAARQSARSVQRALERIGPAALAKECTSLDVAALAEPNKPESGLRQEDGVRWQGICELMTWLHTLRAVLTRPTTTEGTQEVSAVDAPPTVRTTGHAAHSPAPVSPPVPAPATASSSSSGMGFAPPPPQSVNFKLAEEALKPDSQHAEIAPAPSMSEPPATHSTGTLDTRPSSVPASNPPVAARPKAPVAQASKAPGSKAVAFAVRMSGLSGTPTPVASTSTTVLPTGPPSAGFAPPPGPGTSAFDPKPPKAPKRPRASAPPASAVAAAARAAPSPSVAESRPKRERKVSVKFRESSSGDSPTLGEEDSYVWSGGWQTGAGGDRLATSPATGGGGKGKKRFTSYDDESDSDEADDVDEGELDELASDYEEQVERKRRKLEAKAGGAGTRNGGRASGGGGGVRKKRDPAAERERELALIAKDQDELDKDPTRFKVGEAVIARFPNYSYWPAVVLDARMAPPKTQGRREKGSYLVKSIPTGGDHRWVPPDDASILAVTATQLDDIILGRYKSAPPPSWKKWRGELVDAAMMIKDEDRLKEWFAHPTPTEVWQAAQAERKKAARASAAW